MFKIKCSGIYLISVGEFYYVGKSNSIFDRFGMGHYTLLKQGKHHSPLLQEMFDKYGIESFTFKILEHISITEYKREYKIRGKELSKCFNRYLLAREKFWMNKFSVNFSLNKDNKHFN